MKWLYHQSLLLLELVPDCVTSGGYLSGLESSEFVSADSCPSTGVYFSLGEMATQEVENRF